MEEPNRSWNQNEKYKKIFDLISKEHKKISSIEKLKSENNDVYEIVLEDNSKAILKIDSKEENFPWMVQKEIFIYELLNKKGIPTPKIYLKNTESKPNFYLMEYLGQKTLEKINNKGLLTELGRIQSKVHEVEFPKQGIIFHDNIEEYSFRDWRLKNFKEHLEILTEKGIISPEEKIKLKEIVKGFKDSKKTSLCHNDFAPWQAIANKNKIKGIIDWEWAESSDPLYDIAKTEMLMQVFMPGKFEFVKEGYGEKIIEGYNKVRKEYFLVELVGLLYFFRENKEMLKKGRKVLSGLM